MKNVYLYCISLLFLLYSCNRNESEYSYDSRIDSLMMELLYCKQQDSTLKDLYLRYYSLTDSIKSFQDSISFAKNKYSRSHQKSIKYEVIRDYLEKLDRLLLSDSVLIKQIREAKETGIDTLILNVLINNIKSKNEEVTLLKKDNENLKQELKILGKLNEELVIDKSILNKRIDSIEDEKDIVNNQYHSAIKKLEQKDYDILLMRKIPISDISVRNKAKKNTTEICFNVGVNTSTIKGLKEIYIIIKDPANLILTRRNDTFISYKDGNEDWLNYTFSTQLLYKGQKINKFCVSWLHNYEKMAPGRYHISIYIDTLEVGQTFFDWNE